MRCCCCCCCCYIYATICVRLHVYACRDAAEPSRTDKRTERQSDMCFYLRDANTDAKAYGLNLNRFPSINLQPPPTSLPLLHFPFPIFPFSSATSFAARLSIFELHPHSERHVSKHGGFLAGLKWGRGTEEQEKRRRKRRDSSSSRDCLCQPCGSATSLAPIVVAAVCWRLPRQSQIDFPKKNALDVGYISCQMKVVRLEINFSNSY